MNGSVVRTITVATLVACVAYVIAGVFSVDRWTVVLVAVIAVVEGEASWRYMDRTSLTTQQKAQFRLAEGVLRDRDKLYLTGEKDIFDFYNAGLKFVFKFK